MNKTHINLANPYVLQMILEQ